MDGADRGQLARLQAYLEELTRGMGRSERREALGHYVTALLLAGGRKSLERLAARIAPSPDLNGAYRQRMQQAVTVANWSDGELYRRLHDRFAAATGEVGALVIDTARFPKKGELSVGVERQSSGTGRVENRQVAVRLHLASAKGGACVGTRLFLPESWSRDAERRTRCGVPDDVSHASKAELALDMLRARSDWGVKRHVVVAGAGFGASEAFRSALSAARFRYIVGIPPATTVIFKGELPLSREELRARLRALVELSIVEPARGAKSLSVEALARRYCPQKWKPYDWPSSDGVLRGGHFGAIRVHAVGRAGRRVREGPEQWLLVQWSKPDRRPSRFWLSNLPHSTAVGRLACLATLPQRATRDHLEMKRELGLDHFEGRGWTGFHHHCVLVAAAHTFLTLERARCCGRQV